MRRLAAVFLPLVALTGCPGPREPVDRREVWLALQEPAARYRLDASLVFALVAAEANFDARARNGEARGLFQLKPAAWASVSTQPYEPTVWDWRCNLAAGVDYLAWCRHTLNTRQRFSERLLLAAFHYGLDYVESRGFDADRIPCPPNAIYREMWWGNLRPVPPPEESRGNGERRPKAGQSRSTGIVPRSARFDAFYRPAERKDLVGHKKAHKVAKKGVRFVHVCAFLWRSLGLRGLRPGHAWTDAG
ncbi:MAG: hypothetical protein A3G75_16550 [Verrucomicrobia bacterium RIFCSPLOWO2_12_FULL_64_8]|nr:MAG: hypothetical protein A3G75_16550 [Verrucomicrobia bacterium RIFCSPLOWO2_12_FULL_64_8]